MDQAEIERLEDIRAQEEYTRMLQKQEQDRADEFKNREKRAQKFMNRMADTVIKKMDQKQATEDDKIRRYELEKEMRERMDDEKRMQRMRQEQLQMRTFLSKQVEEKKQREHIEKALNDE